MSSRDAASTAPSRRALHSWWERFTKGQRKEEEEPETQAIFGVPLGKSIEYANVAISLSDENGQSFIYGYVPVIVAKCGVFLKEKATDVEGIFRLSGSAKRIKDLQNVFNTPDKYGKGLDWEGYTVHDAANILRRYLNQLPEPIIPLEFYDRFRQPLMTPNLSVEDCIKTYQRLIAELPPLNRQLLLYILDLLAVFASKSEQNLMTAENLAAIFQPGLINHPVHDMSPEEYATSQEVLVFLINHQDNFLLGMQGKDDGRVGHDAQLPVSPSTAPPRKAHTFDVLASNRTEQLRKGGVRRNASLSLRRSSKPAPTATGIGRSNTLPSRRKWDSPTRSREFKKPTGGHMMEIVTTPVRDKEEKEVALTVAEEVPPKPVEPSSAPKPSAPPQPVPTRNLPPQSPEKEQKKRKKDGPLGSDKGIQLPKAEPPKQSSPVTTPSKERPFSTLFATLQSSFGSSEPPERLRSPSNRLRKKRPEGSSADSSTVSLAAQLSPPAQPPTSNPFDAPKSPQIQPASGSSLPSSMPIQNSGFLPTMSPTSSTGSSIASRTSENSDPDRKTGGRGRWRLSRNFDKTGNPAPGPFSPRESSPERREPKPVIRKERRYSEGATSDSDRRGVRGWLDRQIAKSRQKSTERDTKGKSPGRGPSESALVEQPTANTPAETQYMKPGLPTIESGSSENTITQGNKRSSEDTARAIPAATTKPAPSPQPST